jgi:hypothetical protein
MSTYTHNNGFSSTGDGFAVGARGSEVQVISQTGQLYQQGTAITATAAEINRACDVSARIVDVTGSTLAVASATHEGKIITLNRAAGIAVTLPAATGSGDKYTFVVGTTFTGAGTIKVTGNDIMIGTAILFADGGDTVVAFATAATSDTITFAADNSTGGIAGAYVELVDIKADTWFVKYVSDAAGTEATPFSATVS